MTAPLLTARAYHGHAHGTPADRVALTYEDRFLRRKVLTLASGRQLLVDLAQTTSLDHGGVLITSAGDEVLIEAAPDGHEVALYSVRNLQPAPCPRMDRLPRP